MGTPVYFCKFEGEITAVLIKEQATVGNYLCYAHIGQHSECSRAWVRNDTTPAWRKEYQPLLEELESIGYENVYAVDMMEESWQ